VLGAGLEIARVLVRLDDVACLIVNANHGVMRAAEKLLAKPIALLVAFGSPQRQRLLLLVNFPIVSVLISSLTTASKLRPSPRARTREASGSENRLFENPALL
jgi:hypothetical protein